MVVRLNERVSHSFSIFNYQFHKIFSCNYSIFGKMRLLLQPKSLGVSGTQQTEIIPIEPDPAYTGVGIKIAAAGQFSSSRFQYLINPLFC